MNKKFLTSSLACLVLGLACAASAQDSVTYGPYTGPADPTTYDQNEYVQNFNPAAIDPANPSDVILESMTFTVTETVSAAVTVWATTTGQTLYGASYEGVMYAQIPGQGTSTLNNLSSSTSLILNEADSSLPWDSRTVSLNSHTSQATGLHYSFMNESATSFEYDFTSNSGSTTGDEQGNPFSGNLITQFSGTGTTPVNLYGDASVALNVSADGQAVYSDTVVGSVSVTYDYEVVPEPSTWMSAGLLFGMVGISTGSMIWRKRTQKTA